MTHALAIQFIHQGGEVAQGIAGAVIKLNPGWI
jgi:hypothetical protein